MYLKKLPPDIQTSAPKSNLQCANTILSHFDKDLFYKWDIYIYIYISGKIRLNERKLREFWLCELVTLDLEDLRQCFRSENDSSWCEEFDCYVEMWLFQQYVVLECLKGTILSKFILQNVANKLLLLQEMEKIKFWCVFWNDHTKASRFDYSYAIFTLVWQDCEPIYP